MSFRGRYPTRFRRSDDFSKFKRLSFNERGRPFKRRAYDDGPPPSKRLHTDHCTIRDSESEVNYSPCGRGKQFTFSRRPSRSRGRRSRGRPWGHTHFEARSDSQRRIRQSDYEISLNERLESPSRLSEDRFSYHGYEERGSPEEWIDHEREDVFNSGNMYSDERPRSPLVVRRSFERDRSPHNCERSFERRSKSPYILSRSPDRIFYHSHDSFRNRRSRSPFRRSRSFERNVEPIYENPRGPITHSRRSLSFERADFHDDRRSSERYESPIEGPRRFERGYCSNQSYDIFARSRSSRVRPGSQERFTDRDRLLDELEMSFERSDFPRPIYRDEGHVSPFPGSHRETSSERFSKSLEQEIRYEKQQIEMLKLRRIHEKRSELSIERFLDDCKKSFESKMKSPPLSPSNSTSNEDVLRHKKLFGRSISPPGHRTFQGLNQITIERGRSLERSRSPDERPKINDRRNEFLYSSSVEKRSMSPERLARRDYYLPTDSSLERNRSPFSHAGDLKTGEHFNFNSNREQSLAPHLEHFERRQFEQENKRRKPSPTPRYNYRDSFDQPEKSVNEIKPPKSTDSMEEFLAELEKSCDKSRSSSELSIKFPKSLDGSYRKSTDEQLAGSRIKGDKTIKSLQSNTKFDQFSQYKDPKDLSTDPINQLNKTSNMDLMFDAYANPFGDNMPFGNTKEPSYGQFKTVQNTAKSKINYLNRNQTTFHSKQINDYGLSDIGHVPQEMSQAPIYSVPPGRDTQTLYGDSENPSANSSMCGPNNPVNQFPGSQNLNLKPNLESWINFPINQSVLSNSTIPSNQIMQFPHNPNMTNQTPLVQSNFGASYQSSFVNKLSSVPNRYTTQNPHVLRPLINSNEMEFQQLNQHEVRPITSGLTGQPTVPWNSPYTTFGSVKNDNGKAKRASERPNLSVVSLSERQKDDLSNKGPNSKPLRMENPSYHIGASLFSKPQSSQRSCIDYNQPPVPGEGSEPFSQSVSEIHNRSEKASHINSRDKVKEVIIISDDENAHSETFKDNKGFIIPTPDVVQKYKDYPPSPEEMGKLLKGFVISFGTKNNSELEKDPFEVIQESFSKSDRFGNLEIEDKTEYHAPTHQTKQVCVLRWHGIMLVKEHASTREEARFQAGISLINSLAQTCYTVQAKYSYYCGGKLPKFMLKVPEKLPFYKIVDREKFIKQIADQVKIWKHQGLCPKGVDATHVRMLFLHMDDFFADRETHCELLFGGKGTMDYTLGELQQLYKYAEECSWLQCRMISGYGRGKYVGVSRIHTPQALYNHLITYNGDTVRYRLFPPQGLGRHLLFDNCQYTRDMIKTLPPHNPPIESSIQFDQSTNYDQSTYNPNQSEWRS